METRRHHQLKQLCLGFLRGAGCAAAAAEVRCPASRYRADVAGHADPLPKARKTPRGMAPQGFSLRVSGRATTVLIECKQSRPDFLRDSRLLSTLLAERGRLEADRRHLEHELLRAAEPHLRLSGSMLFPDMEDWDFSASQCPAYRVVIKDLRRLDRQIHGDTKFWTMSRYALADLLLIAAPAGLIRRAETPPGWGLLEFPAQWLEHTEWLEHAESEEEVSTQVPARLRRADPAGSSVLNVHRARLLRNIAVTASIRAAPSLPRAQVQLMDAHALEAEPAAASQTPSPTA